MSEAPTTVASASTASTFNNSKGSVKISSDISEVNKISPKDFTSKLCVIVEDLHVEDANEGELD